MNSSDYLRVSPEIEEARISKKPIVALESTIISHGMPYPQNVETALKVEERVRKCGAIPATIAIINGLMRVGLSESEIDYIGCGKHEVRKASRRDLPALTALGMNGATTVTTTMIIANMAGISIFSTGGIGGVHRGAEKTMDISADLEELSKTPVLVVCSGVKSILDIGLTLEYLETRGVPVIGYGTSELPAFYSRHSGYGVDYQINNAGDIARIFIAQRSMKLDTGMLVANPIPSEHSLDSRFIGSVINQSIEAADKAGIRGKEITPFLLAKVKELTNGQSLDSNIELVLNNADLASKIAVEYAKLN